MTLQEIETAINAGKPVFYINKGYIVIKKNTGLYIKSILTGHMSGMNDGGPEFFTE